jgi:excisionase family DNA binding protein
VEATTTPEFGEPLLKPAEAAELLSVPTSWVYEAARERRIPHLKLGKHLRFRRTDLAAWVEARIAVAEQGA